MNLYNPIYISNSFLYSTDLTTDPQSNFNCSSGVYAAIQNWNTVFAFPDQSLMKTTEFYGI